jgi:CheY-like chemotaxis protein
MNQYGEKVSETLLEHSGVQILVLDDSPQDLRLMRCVMEDLQVNYPVKYFDRVFPLVSCLDREMRIDGRASLIFLDWRLNQALSEENSLRVIKTHPVGLYCPVAVMSNSMNWADRKRSKDLGANYVFHKPSDYPRLLASVRRILKLEYLLD